MPDPKLYKSQLRQEMRTRRAAIPAALKARYDRWICAGILDRIRQYEWKVIHCYLPLPEEIDLYPLIEAMLAELVQVIVPETLPRPNLRHWILKSLDELQPGRFGTCFPANSEEYTGDFDLVIVPGLAFTPAGHRLGYGGGYYDAFLARHPRAYKLGAFYPFQKVADLPVEPHDIPLDEVLVPPADQPF